MKKEYETPTIEVQLFLTEDNIMISGKNDYGNTGENEEWLP